MRYENSVFHSLTKHVPWTVFDRLVRRHRADFRVRRLDTKSQFLALLFGQLSGATSLRDIEAGLSSHESRLYHIGASRPARATLADANACRPWQLFADLFAETAARASRPTRRRIADATRILDATRIRLSSLSADWARFGDQHSAAELDRHRLLLFAEADQPRPVAVDHRVGGHHLGVEQRALRQQPVEEPAMPVGPLHHRRDGEKIRSVFQRLMLCSSEPGLAHVHVPINPNCTNSDLF